MNKEVLFISLKAKLKKVFSAYEQSLQDPTQLEILRKGFVYSRVNPSAEILVMGINPSLRTDFLQQDGESYEYSKLRNDRYFKKFSALLPDFESFGITYCDLFYQRHSEQNQIDHFLKDEQGRTFLKEQLKITKSIILEIRPKLILLFNRRGAEFFSKEWLGFTLVPAKGLENDKISINSLYKIEGTDILIYCSAFLGYRTPQKTYAQLKVELPRLLKLLN